jgi:hypothetical protein
MAAVSREDNQAFAVGRVAGLKAALSLTADQEKQWQSVETALLDVAQARFAREQQVAQMRAQQNGQPVDIAARLQTRIRGLRARADEAEKVANAAAPLLGKLDATQKSRFGQMLASNARQEALSAPWRSMMEFVRRSVNARSP